MGVSVRFTRVLGFVGGAVVLGAAAVPAVVGARGALQGQVREAPVAPARDAVASEAAAPTGRLSGTVVSDTTGTPVRRARVALTGAELRGGRATITDDAGAFSFLALPAGRFTLTASKPGYVDVAYGAKRPGRPGVPVQLSEGQQLERLSIALPRGGVVTGIVVDEYGEPAPRTQVRVMRYVIRSGERALQQAGVDQTDDRGLYRIFGLQPGEYMVSATPANQNLGDLRQSVAAEIDALVQQAAGMGVGSGGAGAVVFGAGRGEALAGSGRGQALMDYAAQLQQQLEERQQEQTTAYAPVYYPGTASPSSASTITVGIGEERAGVDFQLQLVPTVRVQGLVVGPGGDVPQGTQVSLVPADLGGLTNIPGLGTNRARVGGDGRFSFSNVTPGAYSLQARSVIREQNAAAAGAQGRGVGGRGGRGGPIAQVLWAATDVSVHGGPVPDIILSLQPGMTVSGRFEFEGNPADRPADLTQLRVFLSPRGPQLLDTAEIAEAEVQPDGRFAIPGVPPGQYSITATLGGGRGGRGGRGGGGGAVGGWSLKSAVVGGVDTLDFPLEVRPNEGVGGALLTFTNRTQQLSGTLQDAMGRPSSDYTIVLFPAEQRYWTPQSRRIVAARPGTDGRFTFRGIPAGEYRLTAITDAEPGEWYDPDFLSQLLGASIPLSLAEGQSRVQDIRLATGN
jgi:hypothetical protein